MGAGTSLPVLSVSAI